MRRPFRRPDAREQAAAIERHLKFMSPSGKLPEPLQASFDKNRLPPKRKYTRRPGARLEKHVLAEVLAALRADPRVAQCERQQSGVFVEGNRHIRVGTPGALDIKGMLVGGRYFEFEVKAEKGRLTPQQEERIATLQANGAIAGCVRSAAEAIGMLP